MSAATGPVGRRFGIYLVLSTAALACQGAWAMPTIDLGVAQAYSGFFFGNVSGAADVEGRLAVGGNLSRGVDIGYRNPFGATAPSLVVRGDVSLVSDWGGPGGSVYNGPAYATDTNASIGPSTGAWITQHTKPGQIVYGGHLQAASWQYGSATRDASFLDFAAARSQLAGLSARLASQAATGHWTAGQGGLQLVGDGVSDVQVFDLGNLGQLANLQLSNIKPGAHIVINSSATQVTFSGHLGGDQADSGDVLALSRDRLIYNLSQATSVSVNSFLNGSVLAVQAALSGTGHLEGTVIADTLSPNANGSRLELGYEPFIPTSAVPEPQSMALLLAGLGLLGQVARQRRSRANATAQRR